MGDYVMGINVRGWDGEMKGMLLVPCNVSLSGGWGLFWGEKRKKV